MSVLEDSVRLAIIDSNVIDIKESVEDVRDRIIRQTTAVEKHEKVTTLLIAKMVERERQEDMKGLAKSLEYLSDLGHNGNLGSYLMMVSEQLYKSGEIVLAYVTKTNILITDRNVYYNTTIYGHNPCGPWTFDLICCMRYMCPLYTFESPLTLASAEILTYKGFYGVSLEKAQFEAVIRTIPGSYKNGAWRQCNGFFGPYLNYEKKTMLNGPPALE